MKLEQYRKKRHIRHQTVGLSLKMKLCSNPFARLVVLLAWDNGICEALPSCIIIMLVAFHPDARYTAPCSNKISPGALAIWWCQEWTGSRWCTTLPGEIISGISSLAHTGCSAVCSGTDQRNHQSSASLAFVRGIHQWLVDSPHKGPVTQKMFPFYDVIMGQWYMYQWSTVYISRDLWQYKDQLSWYGDSHYKDEMVVRPSYLYNGNQITRKTGLYTYQWSTAYRSRASSQYKDHPLWYIDFHHKDETIARMSYLYNGNPHTSKTASLYLDSPFQYKHSPSMCRDSYYKDEMVRIPLYFYSGNY